MTPLGIDPETFRLVAQCLNHYATPGPNYKLLKQLNKGDSVVQVALNEYVRSKMRIEFVSVHLKGTGHLRELGVDERTAQKLT